MPKSAVPIFPGRIRRPTRGAILKARRPRDAKHVPNLICGVAIALFVAGYLLGSARSPVANHLFVAASILVAGRLLWHVVARVLVTLKWIDEAHVEAIALPKLAGRLPPVPEPVPNATLDASYLPAARADASHEVDVGNPVEAAVRKNVAQAVVLKTGAKLVFDR